MKYCSAYRALIVVGSIVATVSASGAPEMLANGRVATAGRAADGLVLFLKRFTPSGGLGPDFNAVSCASCHSAPGVGGAGANKDTLVPWVYVDGSDALGAPTQRFRLTSTSGTFALLVRTTVRRATPSLLGLGYLEAIPGEKLRTYADPLDADHDGISGRLPWREDCVGRFGWQSTVCDIQTFVVGALSNELGIVSFPRSLREITLREVTDLAAYVRDLPPPPAPTSDDGADLFERAKCAACHRPLTGIARIAGGAQEVTAYTDLLVHDMGSGPRHVERDSRTEYRTPPLWGVGATAPYWHDDSAETIEEAILRHGGEASESRRRFTMLPASDKQRLLHFVAMR